MQAVMTGEAFEPWLEVVELTPTRRSVIMPAAGWRIVELRLAERCFNARGQRHSTLPRMATKALMVVSRALVLRWSHPALSGIGMAGQFTTHIPAWDLGPSADLPRYTPFPAPAPFVVLIPSWTFGAGHVVTQWTPGTPLFRSALFREDSHTAFDQPAI